MAEKSKWLALIVFILFSVACSLEGNLGGDTTYIVSFDRNGGDGGSPPSQKIKSSSSVRLPGGSGLSKSDFTFGGWNTDSSGAGKNYSADSFYTPTGNVTLYANWIPVTAPTYTVTFDGNGANGTPPVPQAAKAGSSITIPSGSRLTKSGYTFNGWNSDSSGTGDQYSEGSSYTVDEDITMYANWASPGITYTVTFSANGGSGTPPAAHGVSAGSGITLPSGNGLSRSGSTFGGWNTDASGNGDLYGAGSFYMPYRDITLYAHWNNAVTTTTYTVTYNANGGSGTVPASQTAQSSSAITLPNGTGLTKSGFTFNGWNTNSSGTGTIYQPGESYTVTGNITLYANWVSAGVTYTVNFNANGGSGSVPPAQTANAGSSIILPNESGLSKSGYTFGGWNTNTMGTGTNYKAGDSYTVTGNVTLYAKWDTAASTSYTVTYNANGGSGTVPASQIAQSGSAITLPNGTGLTKGGYTFGGWNTNASGTGTNYNAGASYTVTANITLYAKWDTATTTSYTVTYNANGGSGSVPASQTAQSGLAITLPNGSGLTKSGYTFGGWNTNASGNGSNYNAGASYTVTASVTLYAKWDDNNVSNSGVVPGSNLAAKLSWLQSNVQSGGEYTVEVSSNESIDPTTLSYSGKSNITITLKGVGQARTISLASDGSMFSVGGVTLILDNNIILQGRSSNNKSLVYVTNGTLVMNAGSGITGNTSSGYGGGVDVYVGGTFTMNGGVISGNTASNWGGGVYVGGGGTFTMNGGTISGNNTKGSAGSAGSAGGVGVYQGTFIMNSGTISGNTAGSGGGVYVYDSRSTFTMNGGTISGNTARAGGGVLVSGTFTMSGGEISGNTVTAPDAYGAFGGGVLVSGTFTMSGGVISGNTHRNTFSTVDGGGGIYVYGTFTMSGGVISGNTTSGYGGGVLVDSEGTFTKIGGGTIYGYTVGDTNSNVVKNSSGVVRNNSGHAVCFLNGKRRETTAGPTVNLDSAIDGAAGGWE